MTHAGEEVADDVAKHVIAKAVKDGGVKEAERLAPKLAGDAASRTASKSADAALTATDKAALKAYSGPAFRKINPFLRGEKFSAAESSQISKQVDQISTALGKLPSHEGTVFRGGKFPKDVLDKYKPGETITEDAFTSTSRLEGRNFKGNVKFEIASTDGKYIKDYVEPKYRKQEEVLFDKGTNFQVLSHDVKNGVHYIILKEIP